MPFRHVDLIRWADHVDDHHVQRVRAAFDELLPRIEGLRSLAHGSDVGISAESFDYVVVADFGSMAEWRAFRDHPATVLLVEELISGHVTDRATAQFQTPDSRSAQDVSAAGMDAFLAEPGATVQTDATASVDGPASIDETDDELLARARRAAMAEMDALLAEPDDIG